MVYGIIYEYVELLTGESAYIGKATASASDLYRHDNILKAVDRRHLKGSNPTPFDLVLRVIPQAFNLRIIDWLEASTGTDLQKVLKPLEKERVRLLQPKHNRIRFNKARPRPRSVNSRRPYNHSALGKQTKQTHLA